MASPWNTEFDPENAARDEVQNALIAVLGETVRSNIVGPVFIRFLAHVCACTYLDLVTVADQAKYDTLTAKIEREIYAAVKKYVQKDKQ